MNLLLFIFLLSYTEADLWYETDDGHKSKLFPSEERENNYLTLSYVSKIFYQQRQNGVKSTSKVNCKAPR